MVVLCCDQYLVRGWATDLLAGNKVATHHDSRYRFANAEDPLDTSGAIVSLISVLTMNRSFRPWVKLLVT